MCMKLNGADIALKLFDFKGTDWGIFESLENHKIYRHKRDYELFAEKLEISPSMWSQIKSTRPIGDALARQARFSPLPEKVQASAFRELSSVIGRNGEPIGLNALVR